MKTHIIIALRTTAVCLVFFAGIYTIAVYGIARILPTSGEGNTLNVNGKKYYTNIGQPFTNDRYFQGRPSAVDYNAAGAGGSNKGPTNPDYLATVQARIDSFMAHNPAIKKTAIPAELVTASGSGLDPDISPEAARVQVARIARIRNIDPGRIDQLIAAHTTAPLWGIAGPASINVLQLNLSLDTIQ